MQNSIKPPRLLTTLFVLLCLTSLTSLLKGAEIQWEEAKLVRPNVTTGYGYVIDDLERRVDAGHPMRNTSDPGNWAHELTHYLQNELRNATREVDNCFYVGKGSYIRLLEPNVTLRQVAAEIPESDRGMFYKTHFVDQLSQFNDRPLYVLDETCAFAIGWQYHLSTNTSDKARKQAVREFVPYSRALLRAVRKHDPGYKQLDELEAFVEWNARRAAVMLDEEEEVKPTPPDDFNLFGRYHIRKRTAKFFKRRLTA